MASSLTMESSPPSTSLSSSLSPLTPSLPPSATATTSAFPDPTPTPTETASTYDLPTFTPYTPPAPIDTTGIITLGDNVIFQLPSGQTKLFKLEAKTTINLGKFGSFPASRLLQQPYGLTYENDGRGNITVLSPQVIQALEETQATNEYIVDEQEVQPLTFREIEALKKSGANAAEIISKQISQHANYELKTEYSKEKYKKRKEAKFSKTFKALPPTVPNLLAHSFAKDPSKVQFLRIDTLAQILTFANVRPGGRYIVVEDCGGLVTGAILERMGGEGRLITIHDADSPPAHHILHQMNLSPTELEPLAWLNWATADPSHTPLLPPSEPSKPKAKSDRERKRLEKRKGNNEQVLATRAELFAGDFDGLISVSPLLPLPLISRLSPFLASSSPLIIHSPYPHLLVDAQLVLRAQGGWLDLRVEEGWMRRWQVLPGRTRPEMSGQGGGGGVLRGIKVCEVGEANSYLLGEYEARKRRRLNGGGGAHVGADGDGGGEEDAEGEGDMEQAEEDADMAAGAEEDEERTPQPIAGPSSGEEVGEGEGDVEMDGAEVEVEVEDAEPEEGEESGEGVEQEGGAG